MEQQFVSRAVHAPTSSEGGGKHRTGEEHRPLAGVELRGENVVGIGPEVRAEELTRLGLSQFCQVLSQFPLDRAPCEIGVALRKAKLRQIVHDLGARKRLGEQNQIGVLALQFANAPLPERKALGMGIIHTEDLNALGNPEIEIALQFKPERGPITRLKIKGVNILIFLGRILGILDRPVGARAEPFRMLSDIRMVRRTLEGVIEGDFESVVPGGLHQSVKILQGAKLRVKRLMAALRATDGVGAAGLARFSGDAIVFALAEGLPNGVNRREIEDIKAHAGDVGQPRNDIAERPVASWLSRRRAGKKLVPRREAGQGAVNRHLQLAVVGRRVAVRQIKAHQAGQFG